MLAVFLLVRAAGRKRELGGPFYGDAAPFVETTEAGLKPGTTLRGRADVNAACGGYNGRKTAG